MNLPVFPTNRLQPSLSSPEGVLFDIRKFSIQDGPGIRTTVFFKGCPLNCIWCHNPEGISPVQEIMQRSSRCRRCGECARACPENAIRMEENGPVMDGGLCMRCGTCTRVCFSEARELTGFKATLTDVMAQIRGDIAFYDESQGGVTFSGGEPLLQPDFLLALLKACRTEEIHTALDTSGFAPWQVIKDLLPYVNLFLYDLKAVNDNLHRRCCGVSNRQILANLQKIAALGKPLIIRMPIVPGINDGLAALEEAARVCAALPSLDHIDLLAYHSAAAAKYEGLGISYRLPETQSPTPEHMTEIADLIGSYGLTVHIGG